MVVEERPRGSDLSLLGNLGHLLLQLGQVSESCGAVSVGKQEIVSPVSDRDEARWKGNEKMKLITDDCSTFVCEGYSSKQCKYSKTL